MHTIAILGAGQAGGWAARTLLQEGFSGRIVLLGEEAHPPHERPPLSKAVLAGDAPPESTRLHKPEAFEALALDWRPGARVARIDRVARHLHLAGGEALTCDAIVAARAALGLEVDAPPHPEPRTQDPA